MEAADAVTTASLRGERPVAAHASGYAELFGEPAVAATLWPDELGGPRTPEQAREILAEDIAHWERAGFGPWAWFERASGRFAGRGGLEETPVGGGGVEVLYALVPACWGRGYATEVAVAAVARAREVGLGEVMGFTLTTNLSSQRVLQKAGMRYERVIEHAGRPHWLGRVVLRRGD